MRGFTVREVSLTLLLLLFDAGVLLLLQLIAKSKRENTKTHAALRLYEKLNWGMFGILIEIAERGN